jgi:hypothetical protein
LLTGLALIFFDIRDTGFISVYRAASNCSSPADALTSAACRYRGEAQVVSTSTDAGHKAVVSFQSLPRPPLQHFSSAWRGGGQLGAAGGRLGPG